MTSWDGTPKSRQKGPREGRNYKGLPSSLRSKSIDTVVRRSQRGRETRKDVNSAKRVEDEKRKNRRKKKRDMRR